MLNGLLFDLNSLKLKEKIGDTVYYQISRKNIIGGTFEKKSIRVKIDQKGNIVEFEKQYKNFFQEQAEEIKEEVLKQVKKDKLKILTLELK